MVFSRIYLQQWGLKQLQAVDINKYSSSSRQHISNIGHTRFSLHRRRPKWPMSYTHAIYTYYAWCTRSGWPRVSFINGMRQVEFLTRLNPYTYALKEDFGSIKILHCISESLYRSFQHFDKSLIWIMVSSVALRFNFLLQLTGHQERESHSDYL